MDPTGSRTTSRTLRPDDGRLVRGRRSRQRIREAARALFRERGFDATTLRAIAERAGMGASSIYRHIRSKEELLVEELADLQETAWTRFRSLGSQGATARERVRKFLDMEHELMVRDPDLTIIALRATTQTEQRVSRRVLALQDRTIGLVTEVLQAGRARGELGREVDPLVAARTITHITSGARLAWANGLLSADDCRSAIDSGVDLLFRGLQRSEGS